MIVVVTPNPALDVTWHLPALQPGQTHQAATARVRAGGKGLNVARVLHAQQHAVTAVAAVGGAAGLRFRAELAGSGLPARLLERGAETRTSVCLVDEGSGEATVVNEVGLPLTPAEWARVHAAVGEALDGATCLVGSGSLPPDADQALYADLVRAAHARGVPCVVDATGAALLLAAQAGADVLKPNARELADATGSSDPVRAAASLVTAGARLVVVSLGADGLLAVSACEPGRVVRARLDEPLRGNATGAGDAVVAALAAGLALPGAMEPAALLATLARAVAWSAAAVLSPVAGEVVPTWPRLLPRVTVTTSAAHP